MKPSHSTGGHSLFAKLCDPLEVATALSNLARLCLDQEKYEESNSYPSDALEISQTDTPAHPELANSPNNLADVHAIQGRYAGAEPLFRQALSILEYSFGQDHPEVAYGPSHLAKPLFSQARYAEAETLQRRAITILRKAPGQNESTRASSLNNLAELASLQILANNPATRSTN